MVEISTDQLTTIENAFVKLRGLLDPQTTPKDVMQMILDAEQICSGLIDKEGGNAGSQGYANSGQGGPM